MGGLNRVVDAVPKRRHAVPGSHEQRIVRNVDHTMASVSRDIDPLLADARSITHKVDGLLDMVGPQQQQEIQSILHNGDAVMGRVNTITTDAEEIVHHIREGRGTVGAFLMETVGEAMVMKGVEMAKRWWAGAGDAQSFVASQPAKPVAAIARAAANIIDTRRDRLFALAERLEK